MSDLLGKTLGRYRLEKLQGRGGMAEVFKAWDPNTQRHVAIKVLYLHLAEEPNFRERFDREGKLIASLNHPHIVTLYDFDRVETETGAIHYMVMPFITGPSLKDIIQDCAAREERLPLERIVTIVEGIASALDYAHTKGMVHRDIKPANILFDEYGSPLLTDFGLARLTFGARLTQSGTASGTPAYMSPEQGTGEPGDHRSDVYSLGIILYEMLTNELPFTADTSMGMIVKHLKEPLPSVRTAVPELSPAVEAVVYRATAKDPASRYQSAGELAAELRSALRGERLSRATLRAPWQQARRRSAPQLLGLLGLASLVAILLIGVGALGALQSATPTPTVPRVSAMTGGVPFSTGFEEGEEFNAGWPITRDGLLRREIVDGQYIMRAQAPGAYSAVFQPFDYASVIVETNATLNPNSQTDSAYGIIFRYVNEDNYYVFAVHGRQQVSIWVRLDGEWRELRGGETNWTPSDRVRPPGEANHLSVLAEGDHLLGFVNGTRVVDVRDDSIREGAVGFYIATTERPLDEILTEVAFDNIIVTNAVPSMSG